MQHYRIVCLSDPGLLGRITDFFSRFSSIPDRLHMIRGADRGSALVEIAVSDLSPDQGQLLAARLQSCPLVVDVELTQLE